MLVVLVLFQLWYKSTQRCLDVSDKTVVKLGPTSELFTANVDLHNRRILRKELLIRKVGPQHQQHTAVHHCVIARRETKQTGHAHVEWVIKLDVLFPAHRMNDGSLEFCRQLKQFRVSASA